MKKLITFFTALLFILPGSVNSATIHIETEDFVSMHDIALEVIRSVPGPGCSGGNMLYGLDYTDEWVEYSVTVGPYGTYMPYMRLRGDFGQLYRLELQLFPESPGLPQTIAVEFTGLGYG